MSTTFESLRGSRNFRRYYAGQTISLAGTWVQSVAQGWLVLRLSGSITHVGIAAAAQTLPILLFSPSAGVLIDRHDTKRILIWTQVAAGVLAAVLGLLVELGDARLWVVYTLAVMLGMITAIDNPARQAFLSDLVAPELLGNAVTLNTININAARVIGPGIAAVVIALTDVGPCFFINALSFVAVVIALLRIDSDELFHRRRETPHPGQLIDGLRYVWGTPQLRVPLVMMALIGTLTYEFMVSLPALAARTFHGSASTFGVMTGSMGFGAVIGGLVMARHVRHGTPILIRQAFVFGLLVIAAAASPTLPIAVALLTAVGAASLVFLTRANTTIQLLADPEMRGRVMGLWTVAFLGTTPIGAPTIGFIGQHFGPRWALVVGGAAAIVAAAYGAIRSPHAVEPVLATTDS